MLVAELEEEFGSAKIFRPNRDVRFSKDKSPYKTEVAAVFSTADGGGFYVRAKADGLGAGGGYYDLASDQLERFREAAADDRSANELRALIAAVGALEGMAVTSEELKTAPRGVPADHPHVDLLRRKNLVFMRTVEPGPIVHTASAWTSSAGRFATAPRCCAGSMPTSGPRRRPDGSATCVGPGKRPTRPRPQACGSLDNGTQLGW